MKADRSRAKPWAKLRTSSGERHQIGLYGQTPWASDDVLERLSLSVLNLKREPTMLTLFHEKILCPLRAFFAMDIPHVAMSSSRSGDEEGEGGLASCRASCRSAELKKGNRRGVVVSRITPADQMSSAVVSSVHSNRTSGARNPWVSSRRYRRTLGHLFPLSRWQAWWYSGFATQTSQRSAFASRPSLRGHLSDLAGGTRPGAVQCKGVDRTKGADAKYGALIR